MEFIKQVYFSRTSQDIVMMDDMKKKPETLVSADQTLRPFTCISPFNRSSKSRGD